MAQQYHFSHLYKLYRVYILYLTLYLRRGHFLHIEKVIPRLAHGIILLLKMLLNIAGIIYGLKSRRIY